VYIKNKAHFATIVGTHLYIFQSRTEADNGAKPLGWMFFLRGQGDLGDFCDNGHEIIISISRHPNSTSKSLEEKFGDPERSDDDNSVYVIVVGTLNKAFLWLAVMRG